MDNQITTNVMGVAAKDYGNINASQIQSACELANEIKENKNIRNFKTILDIGCGTGNVTKIVAEMLPSVENVYGLDMDTGMIKEANGNRDQDSKPNPGIKFNFYTSDITSPWELLDKNITSLESSVDLTFSNMALHWLLPGKREQALKNIFRLLKPGYGWFYSRTAVGRLILEHLETDEERNVIEPLMNLESIGNPTKEGNEWKVATELVGFENVAIRFEEVIRNLRKEEYQHFMQLLISFYVKKYFKNDAKLDDGTREILIKAIQRACGHEPQNNTSPHFSRNLILSGMKPHYN